MVEFAEGLKHTYLKYKKTKVSKILFINITVLVYIFLIYFVVVVQCNKFEVKKNYISSDTAE